MAQTVSRRPVTVEIRVRSQLNLCEIYSEECGTAVGFFPSISV
jgi:hypothetical protein